MNESEDLRFVDRKGNPFPGRYTKAVREMWGLLWRLFPAIRDPADRDRVIEKTLSRVADHEAKRGEAKFLRGLIWRIFPQAAISMLRTRHYKLETVPIKKAAGDPMTVDAKSGELPTMRRHGVELLKMCNERERQVLYLRAIVELEYGEIAEKLGLSEANVRQILHRLKERLQRVEDHQLAKSDRS